MDETCENCKYFMPPYFCRRYPPTKNKSDNSEFTTVYKGSWCGEFERIHKRKWWRLVEIKPDEDIKAPLRTFP